MDRPDANRTFENNHGNSDVPTNMNDDFITEFSPATSSAIDTLLDFIFNEDSNSSTSSDSTISEEPRGNPSANHNIGCNSNEAAAMGMENGNQANNEQDVLLKLNKKIKKVEKEVEELRKSIAGLCK